MRSQVELRFALLQGLASGGFLDLALKLINDSPYQSNAFLRTILITHLACNGFILAASQQIFVAPEHQRVDLTSKLIYIVVRKEQDLNYIEPHIKANGGTRKTLFDQLIQFGKIQSALALIAEIPDQDKITYWSSVPEIINNTKIPYIEKYFMRLLALCPSSKICEEILSEAYYRNHNEAILKKNVKCIIDLMKRYKIENYDQAGALLSNFKMITKIFLQLFKNHTEALLANIDLPHEILLEIAAFTLNLPSPQTNQLIGLLQAGIFKKEGSSLEQVQQAQASFSDLFPTKR